MGVRVLRVGMLAALLMSTAGATAIGQDQLEKYRTQMANMPVQPPPAAPPVNSALMASSLAQWRAVQSTSALPFDSYASFLRTHPGWPGEAANRRAAEGKAVTGSPASVIAYFRRFPPMTAAGGVAFANALQSTGATVEAAEAARAAWRRGSLAPQDESTVLTNFAGTLTPDDHDARMDALLWQGATSVAARQLAFTSPGRRPLFEARLAYRTSAPNAATLDGPTLTMGGGDAGYIADRATWLRNTLQIASARAWLARPRTLETRPGNVERFYEVLWTQAKSAAADNQWQLAYDIARQVDDAYPEGTDVSLKSYGERDDYTNLVWLAGQAALKKLGRPADAMTLFDRYGRASVSPQVRAKGFYWAGRAAQAAGRPEADAFFQRAAGYRDQFYGQLANEHLGRALVPPPPVMPAPVDPTTRGAFYGRETVQAAQFLGSIGDWQDQTAFVRQIALDAKSDSDHVLANELSRRINRPDLGVMVGRSALQNGFTDYSAAGFPTVAIPAGYDDQWTIIHAISRQESQFDRAAVSHAGARGLMQLMPGTARDTATKLGLSYTPASLTTDTSYNVQLGSSYFQRIFNSYGSFPLAIAAYNAGPGNVNKWLAANGDPRTGAIDMVDWIEAIPFTETRGYVQRVIENAVVYDLINPQRARSRGPANLSWYLGNRRPG